MKLPFLPSPPESQREWLHQFFEADRAERAFRPHAAARSRAAFLSRCPSDTKAFSVEERSRFAFLCAIVLNESNERSSVRSLPIVSWFSSVTPLPWDALAALPQAEQVAWQARAVLTNSGWSIPRDRGFLALENIRQLFPNFQEARWWRYEAALAQRQPTQIASAYAELLAGSGAKKPFAVPDPEFAERRFLDGLTYGIVPELGFQSFLGFNAGARWWNERIGDEPRAISLVANAYSNSSVVGEARYEDRKWFSSSFLPVIVKLAVSGGWDRKRYLLGARDVTADFHQSGFTSEGRLQFPVWESLSVEAGYHFFYLGDETVSGGTLVPPIGAYSGRGPIVSLSWDSRDSAIVPRDGYRVLVEWMQRAFDKEPTSNEIRGRAEAYLVLSKQLSWSGALVTNQFWGSRRRDLVPVWGNGHLSLPGLVRERYRALSGLGGTTEFQREFSDGFRMLAFLTALGLTNPLVPGDTVLLGGGLGAELSFSQRTRPTLRAELGWLSSEWSVRAFWLAPL